MKRALVLLTLAAVSACASPWEPLVVSSGNYPEPSTVYGQMEAQRQRAEAENLCRGQGVIRRTNTDGTSPADYRCQTAGEREQSR